MGLHGVQRLFSECSIREVRAGRMEDGRMTPAAFRLFLTALAIRTYNDPVLDHLHRLALLFSRLSVVDGALDLAKAARGVLNSQQQMVSTRRNSDGDRVNPAVRALGGRAFG